MENDDVKEYKNGEQQILVLNLATMAHKHQTRFLNAYHAATKSGVDGVKFVKTWNHYAQDITEHVFWSIKEPKKKFTERGK